MENIVYFEMKEGDLRELERVLDDWLEDYHDYLRNLEDHEQDRGEVIRGVAVERLWAKTLLPLVDPARAEKAIDENNEFAMPIHKLAKRLNIPT